MKMILLEKKIIVFSDKASKVSQFMIGMLSLFPGSILFKYNEHEEVKTFTKGINKYGLPLKKFNNRTLLLPAASIRDLK